MTNLKAEECGVRPRLKTATFYNILYDVRSTPVITDWHTTQLADTVTLTSTRLQNRRISDVEQ